MTPDFNEGAKAYIHMTPSVAPAAEGSSLQEIWRADKSWKFKEMPFNPVAIFTTDSLSVPKIKPMFAMYVDSIVYLGHRKLTHDSTD